MNIYLLSKWILIQNRFTDNRSWIIRISKEFYRNQPEKWRRIRSDNSSGTRCMYMRITLTSTPTKEALERKACQSGWAWHANMIQESETRRNARTYAGVADRAEWSSDENGARVHRFRGREGIDKGLGQVRVAEQIYWIQGGSKSGEISVTKERCLLVYWEPEWKEVGEGGRAKKGKHGDRRWKKSHPYSIDAFICWSLAENVLQKANIVRTKEHIKRF